MSSVFEKSIGVSKFAQMIRDAGGPMSNGKLLGIAKSGGFVGYRIYIYRSETGTVEGWISESEADRWISAHSVEQQMRQDILEFSKRRIS